LDGRDVSPWGKRPSRPKGVEMAINATTSEEIYAELCLKIEKLAYMPGTRLSENELAGEYGVSRHIIRGALAHLKSRRLVEVYPQRGTYVSLIDMTFISDVLYMREAVEQEALRRMFEGDKTEENEAKLDAMVVRMRQIVEAQSNLTESADFADAFYELDNLFHAAFLQYVDHTQVMELISDHYIHIRRWRNYEVRTSERIKEIVLEHGQIADAIEARDYKKTCELLHKHLDTVSRYSKPLKEAEAQYFV